VVVAVVTERKSLDLDGVRAESLMHIAGIWVQLAGREAAAGRLSKPDMDRLRIIEQVIEDWRLIGGRTGLPRIGS
jgi:hypothetical protein